MFRVCEPVRHIYTGISAFGLSNNNSSSLQAEGLTAQVGWVYSQ